MLKKIHVLSIIPGLAKSSGGPTFSVISLTEAVARCGIQNTLVTVKSSSGELEEIPKPDLVPLVRVNGHHLPKLRLMWASGLKDELLNQIAKKSVNIIHSHGIWTQPNHVAVSVARKNNLQHVISTHGMLEPWALLNNAWKKRPAWLLYQYSDLSSAAVLRATAQQEVDALRALGFRNPIALIANGVDLPQIGNTETVKTESLKSSIRTAIFLSRIHPKKGLLNLVAAWAAINRKSEIGNRKSDRWRMVIVGPDEGGHAAQVRKAIAEVGLSDVFEIKPPVYGSEKDALFASADLFVLPTYSENFGIAIAEALAAGVPVITTKGTPWAELISHQCGWWIDIGVDPLAAALREAMAMTDDQLRTMGRRGRKLVDENYGWAKIGKEMSSVYGWLLYGGRPPPCIQKK